MANATGGITITGTIDGTSVLGEVAVVNGPLLQYYDDAKFSPNWATIYNNGAGVASVPTLYPKMYDSSSGADLTGTVSLTNITYNNDSVTFNSTTGIASAPSIVAGKLLKTTMPYGTATIECVKIIGNPANAATNPDDDRIAFYGTCTSGGGQIRFNNIGKDIQIRHLEDTDVNDIYLTVPTGYESYISRNATTGETVATRRLATLVKNGEPVTVSTLTGYEFRWADITDKNDKPLSNSTSITISTSSGGVTNDTITIDAGAVNSMMLLRCRMFDGSGASANLVATSVVPVFDLSDELQVRWMVRDSTNSTATEVEYIGDEDSSQQIVMRSGSSLRFRPVIFNRQTGGQATAFSNIRWEFGFDDNNGDELNDIINSPVEKTDPLPHYAIIDYNDVVKTVGGVKTRRPVHLSATTQTDVQ